MLGWPALAAACGTTGPPAPGLACLLRAWGKATGGASLWLWLKQQLPGEGAALSLTRHARCASRPRPNPPRPATWPPSGRAGYHAAATSAGYGTVAPRRSSLGSETEDLRRRGPAGLKFPAMQQCAKRRGTDWRPPGELVPRGNRHAGRQNTYPRCDRSSLGCPLRSDKRSQIWVLALQRIKLIQCICYLECDVYCSN